MTLYPHKKKTNIFHWNLDRTFLTTQKTPKPRTENHQMEGNFEAIKGF